LSNVVQKMIENGQVDFIDLHLGEGRSVGAVAEGTHLGPNRVDRPRSFAHLLPEQPAQNLIHRSFTLVSGQAKNFQVVFCRGVLAATIT